MVKDLFVNNFQKLSETYNWLTEFKPFFIYKIKPNLSMMIVHSMKFDFKLKQLCTIPCLKNCKICPFIFQNSFIQLCKLMLPVLCNGNCESKGLVYIIMCIKCHVFYIGETSKTLKVRISQHLNCIKRFVPYFNVENEVAFHFRKIGHNLNEHFRVCIFKDNLDDSIKRKSIEMDLIYLFKSVFNCEILNNKI